MIPTLSLDTIVPLTGIMPILAAVASAALKGALPVALAALATATVLRHRPAAVRHAVWTGALAAHLLLIVASPLLPAVSRPGFRLPAWLTAPRVDEPVLWLPAAVARGVAPVAEGPVGAGPIGTGPAAPAAVAIGQTPAGAWDGGGVTATPSASASVTASTRATWQASPTSRKADPLTGQLGTLWVLGALLILGRLLLGTARVLTLARAAERVADPSTLALAQRIANRLGITRPITILRGDRLSIPITWGVVYPTVLLPAESAEWPEERLRVVLVHEIAHVKRLDALTQLVAQVAIAVFWFDPLVWLAARRMRAEREHACDDHVLRDGTRPSLYANELLDMVRRLADRAGEAGAPAFAALAMARRSEFEGRMLAILDPGADRHALSRAASVAFTGIALVLLAPLAALRPSEARPIASTPAAAHAATTTVLTMPVERRSATAVRATASARGAASARAVAGAVTTTAAQVPVSPTDPQAPVSATAPVVAQERLPIIYSCSREDLRTNNTMHSTHTDREKAGPDFVEHAHKMYGYCSHIVLFGRVRLTPDERDIESLSPGGRVQLRERTFDSDRSLIVTSGDDGQLRRSYSEDGRPAAFDASAQAWAARALQRFARESGVGAADRVSRIRARGGVPAVLSEIAAIRSAGAKRAHYEALLATSLTPTEVDAVVRHAGSELAGSSGDLRAVLRRVPQGSLRTLSAALESAIGRMSDGDKHHVLAGMLQGADTPTLLTVLRLAEKIHSDGDKTSLLRRAAPRVLDGSSAPLREAFFRAYATINSDGDKTAVLMAALSAGASSPALTLDVIRAARQISSDGDKSSVLRTIARNRLVTTDALRDEYIKSARTIGSDGDYRAVIDALLGGKPGA